jgi:hypothetical protein
MVILLSELIIASLKYFGPMDYDTCKDKVEMGINASTHLKAGYDSAVFERVFKSIVGTEIYKHESGWYFLREKNNVI